MGSDSSRLGRGLEALIPLDGSAAGERQGIREVALDTISPNPHQPRSPIKDEDLEELAVSIKEHGVLQPPIVTEAPDGYQLIAGERRWRAAALAGLESIPVLIKNVAASRVLEMALVENIQRADLNPLEEASAYAQLIDDHGLTQEEAARRVGKSRASVTNKLRLLKAGPAVREALSQGAISEGHARALLGIDRVEQQEALLVTVVRKGLNVRQTEDLVRRATGERKVRRKREPITPETRALEADFRRALGTKVTLKRRGDAGRLVVYFYSDEELDALYEVIVGTGGGGEHEVD